MEIIKSISFLLIIMLAFSFGCGKKDRNPVSINPTEGIVKANPLINVFPQVLDVYPTNKITSQDIVLFCDFSLPMDKETLTNQNIELENTTEGLKIEIKDIEYVESLRRLKFKPCEPLAENKAYMVTIKRNVKNINGKYLDGNRNNISEISPSDDYRWTFYLGSATEKDIFPPKILSTSPSQNELQVPINTEIKVTFNKSMEVSSFNNSIDLKDDKENLVSLEKISWSNVYRNNDTVTIRPSFILKKGIVYQVIVKNNLRDISGNTLDGNNNGKIEVVDNYTWKFRTETQDNLPTVSAYYLIGTNYVKATFSKEMNIDTLNSNNITLLDSEDNKILGRIVIAGDKKSFNFTLENASSGNYTLIINRFVEDTAGNKLDVNKNGFGGEEEDIYRYDFTYSIISSDINILYNPWVKNNQDTYSAYFRPIGGRMITRIHVVQETEENCDYFYVYNAEGSEIWGKSGKHDIWIDINPTPCIRTRLTTDRSVQRGFGGKVEDIKAE